MDPVPMTPIVLANVDGVELFEDNPYTLAWYKSRLGVENWDFRYIGTGPSFKGILVYRSFPDGRREIRVILITSDERRKGLGRKVIEQLKRCSDALGMVVDERNLDLQLFLRAMGFKGEYASKKKKIHSDNELLFKWFSRRAVESISGVSSNG